LTIPNQLIGVVVATENLKEKVTKFFLALNEVDVEYIFNSYHPSGGCWTSGNTVISGFSNRDEIKSAAGEVLGLFPEGLTFSIDGMVCEGDRVAVEAVSDGMHVSGKRYHNKYHFLFEFRDGLIYRLKEYMDTEMITDVLCDGRRT